MHNRLCPKSLMTIFMLCFMVNVWAMPEWKNDKLLKSYSDLPAASSAEAPVRQKFIKDLKELKQSYQVDGMGNVYGVVNPCKKSHCKKILLMAHMDEVGLMIKDIDNNGFIRAEPLGGWVTHVIWADQWLIVGGKRPLTAVSGVDSSHVLTDFSKTPKLNWSGFFLDTGLSKKQLQELGIRPGLTIVPKVSMKKLANRLVVGKAFDDRAGMVVMLKSIAYVKENIEKFKQVEIQFAASVQEEVGMRGAALVRNELQPDILLNLESGVAHDYPQQFSKQHSVKLGGGPTLFFYERSMLPSQHLVAFILEQAKSENLPIQLEMEPSYGQDGAFMQTAGHGVEAVNIGIPVRYAHSHYGVMSLNDLILTENLIYLLLENIHEYKLEKNA